MPANSPAAPFLKMQPAEGTVEYYIVLNTVSAGRKNYVSYDCWQSSIITILHSNQREKEMEPAP